MNAKERMHQSIGNMIDDMLKMQDIVVQLSREIYELHVTKEHEAKHDMMKNQISDLQLRLDSMQDFLVACDNLAEWKESHKAEIDFV